MSTQSVSVSLVGSGRVTISGVDLNWVAGTRERFQEEIKHRVSRPFWWRWGALPIFLFCGLLSTAIATTLQPTLSASGHGIPYLGLTAGFVSAGIAFVLSTVFQPPMLVLTSQTSKGRLWFQHPVVESAKTVAIFIGAIWAAMQIVRFLR